MAEPSFEFLFDGGYVTDVSDDGTVVVGNTAADLEPFRWTEATGLVPLGMATGPVIGTGAGIPGVSADGTRVASTILTADSLYATQGLWTLGQGWQQLMPPTPPDGGLVDLSYGSVWGISGDGANVVGLYWRPGVGNRAHASNWTEPTGVYDLGSTGGTGGASRANGANYDGSVIVGWDEHATGPWRPCAWVNGNQSILSPDDGFGQGYAVTPDGHVVTGYQNDPRNGQLSAALWRWNGTGWDEAEILGVLQGTFNPGRAIGYGISADASIIVGFNTYAGDPFDTDGFFWTEETGMVDVDTFLAEHDLTPANFDVKSLQAVTTDGTEMFGFGSSTVAPFVARTFVIRLDTAVGAPVIADASTTDLLFARPNPTRGPTTLTLDLPRDVHGTLTIHDLAGRLVRQLSSGSIPSGRHEFAWDGRDENGSHVSAGVYCSRFVATGMHDTCKLVVLRGAP